MYLFDKEEQELLTEDEMIEKVNEEIEIEELYLEEIHTYSLLEIWNHLEEDFKLEMLNEISDRIIEDRFINRDF